MKPLIIPSLVMCSVVAGEAAAALCDGPSQVKGGTLSTLMTGSLVCGRPAAGYPGPASDRWQEEHIAGGNLFDYKKGPGDAVDPRTQVGSWTVNANDTVTHTYTPGGASFTWTVHQVSGTTYSFCTGVGGSEVVEAFVAPNGGSGCGGSFP